MEKKGKKLAIIIPIFNEEKNIYKVFTEWSKVVSRYYKYDYKFILINDGSTDNTHNVVKKIKKPYVFYINQKNIGHGNTCLKGYKIALQKKFDLIMQIDSDYQCDPKYFRNFLKHSNKEEAVFGFRATREDGKLRKFFSFLLSLLIFFKTFTFVKDPNVPYRVLKSKVLESEIKKIPAKVLLKNVYLSYLIQKNYKIKWININFRKRLLAKQNIILKL